MCLAFQENPPLIGESFDAYPLVFYLLVTLADLLLKFEDFPLEVVLLGDRLG